MGLWYIHVNIHYWCDKMDKAFLLCYCILQAFVNWTVGRPRNNFAVLANAQKTYENFLCEYNFTTKIFQHWLAPCYTSTSPIGSAHISFCLTQQAISSACSVISSIIAHHTRLVKLFSFNFGLCENYFMWVFFWRKFTRQKKAKYGITLVWSLKSSYVFWL